VRAVVIFHWTMLAASEAANARFLALYGPIMMRAVS